MSWQEDFAGGGPSTPAGAPDWRVLVLIAAVAAVTYLPFLHLPPLIDDYGHVRLAERYGPPPGWVELFRDPLYRCRATSLWLTAITLHLTGYSVLAFHLTGIVLHTLNACLVYALGISRWIGWRISAAAAIVFAARERHHEAVIWYASVHELLVFAFILAAVLGWIRWLEGGRRLWLIGVAASWSLALLSKESGILLMWFLPAVALLYPGRRRAAAAVLLLGALSSTGYFLWAWSGQQQHQHFHDGTFVFGPHFIRAAANSAARGIWIWGLAALATLLWRRSRAPWKTAAFALTWFVFALAPYAFLTYMPRIPSRHHYIASAGAALLIGAAFRVLMETVRHRRMVGAAAALVFLAHNFLYLWAWKRPRFVERAAVVERLLATIQENPAGPTLLRCPDLPLYEAQLAVHYRLGLNPGAVLAEEAPGRQGMVYDCRAPAGGRRPPAIPNGR